MASLLVFLRFIGNLATLARSLAFILFYGPQFLRQRRCYFMSFTIPSFPLAVNIWRNGSGPPAVPDVVTVGNLTWGRRVTTATGVPNDASPDTLLALLLVPALTDVRDISTPSGADLVEVPAGSGRLYQAKQVDDIGKGFANEHRFAVIYKLFPWPQPIP
jgi:hypothetical protein